MGNRKIIILLIFLCSSAVLSGCDAIQQTYFTDLESSSQGSGSSSISSINITYVTNYNDQCGLSGTTVQCIYAQGSTIIAGTLTLGVVYSLDEGSNWNILNHSSNNLAGDEVYSIAADQKNWYIGTINGLSIYGISNKTVSNYKTGTRINKVLVSQTKIYLATDDGIYASDIPDISWTLYNSSYDPNIQRDDFYSLYMSDQKLYAGSTAGVLIYDTLSGVFEFHNAAVSLGSDKVLELMAAGNTILAGAGYAVSRSADRGTNWQLDTNSIQSATVTGFASDSAGNIYMIKSQAPLYVSIDNGRNWLSIHLPNSGYWGLIANDICINQNQIYIAQVGGIYVCRF